MDDFGQICTYATTHEYVLSVVYLVALAAYLLCAFQPPRVTILAILALITLLILASTFYSEAATNPCEAKDLAHFETTKLPPPLENPARELIEHFVLSGRLGAATTPPDGNFCSDACQIVGAAFASTGPPAVQGYLGDLFEHGQHPVLGFQLREYRNLESSLEAGTWRHWDDSHDPRSTSTAIFQMQRHHRQCHRPDWWHHFTSCVIWRQGHKWRGSLVSFQVWTARAISFSDDLWQLDHDHFEFLHNSFAELDMYRAYLTERLQERASRYPSAFGLAASTEIYYQDNDNPSVREIHTRFLVSLLYSAHFRGRYEFVIARLQKLGELVTELRTLRNRLKDILDFQGIPKAVDIELLLQDVLIAGETYDRLIQSGTYISHTDVYKRGVEMFLDLTVGPDRYAIETLLQSEAARCCSIWREWFFSTYPTEHFWGDSRSLENRTVIRRETDIEAAKRRSSGRQLEEYWMFDYELESENRVMNPESGKWELHRRMPS